ncbi:hypothetical protein, partial [Nitrosomonas sp.]|uniref:hypothetical protein n=1 Tax=Nitrosomonas sp. TaxID=42353 RepID=UPI0025D2D0D8
MVIKPDNSLNAKRMIRVNISRKMPFSLFLTDEKGGNLQHPTCFPQHLVQSIDFVEEKQSGQKHPCPDFKGIETGEVVVHAQRLPGNTPAL